MGRFVGFAFFLWVASCATSQTLDEDDSGVTPLPDAGIEAGACTGSLKKCGTACVDTTKDPSNCGACNSKCANGQFCAGSKCNSTCTMPLTLCGQFCVDLTS